MSRAELIRKYRKIFLETENQELAIAQIVAEVNTLVWGGTKKRLTRTEKIEILEEIFNDPSFQKSLPSRGFGRIYDSTSIESINEADNSHILDVISALKKGVKD